MNVINSPSIEKLKHYLTTHFPNLELCAPLFYKTAVGIRFEIGAPDIPSHDPRYLKFVYMRSQILFNQVFSKNESMFLVVNSTELKDKLSQTSEGIDVFRKYLTNKNRFEEVKHIELPHVYGDENLTTHRYFLLCKVSDVDYKGLLTAIGNNDLGVEPKVKEEVFFINTENHVIFHLYDDRGLDIVAEEKQVLRGLYHRYNDWIFNYDRNKIDLIFNN